MAVDRGGGSVRSAMIEMSRRVAAPIRVSDGMSAPYLVRARWG